MNAFGKNVRFWKSGHSFERFLNKMNAFGKENILLNAFADIL
jgi:hypothetical protein